MHPLLSELDEKAYLAVVTQLGRKVCMFPGFTNPPSIPPAKSGLPVLSMLLLFDTMSRTTASKPQGVWQGNEKGISTADALKDDLRTQSQEEDHKKIYCQSLSKS